MDAVKWAAMLTRNHSGPALLHLLAGASMPVAHHVVVGLSALHVESVVSAVALARHHHAAVMMRTEIGTTNAAAANVTDASVVTGTVPAAQTIATET